LCGTRIETILFLFLELEPNVLHRWLCLVIWQVETKSWVNKTIKNILWNYETWLGNLNAKMSLITYKKKLKKKKINNRSLVLTNTLVAGSSQNLNQQVQGVWPNF